MRERMDRFAKYMQIKGLNDNQVTVDCGLAVGLLAQARRGKSDLGLKTIGLILDKYQDLNKDWLLSGEGEMLNENPSLNQEKDDDITIVPLLPIMAQAGSLSCFADSVSLRDCELIISPIKGADFAMRVSGDSMSPEYPNGSQVLIKRINPDIFIEWGKVFVLDTYNGSVMKRIVPGSKPDRVMCVSNNPDPSYAPFEVRWEDIIGIYRVLLCMSVK